jgi:hypothetical protein
MKTKLTATILLTIICLSFVVGGISSPQPVAHAQPPSLDFTRCTYPSSQSRLASTRIIHQRLMFQSVSRS